MRRGLLQSAQEITKLKPELNINNHTLFKNAAIDLAPSYAITNLEGIEPWHSPYVWPVSGAYPCCV